jgi:lysophospholipase L1-like esterase
VLLGDSILRNIRHISDSNVISLSGSTFSDLTNLISKHPSIISNASTILIHCGTNHISKEPVHNIMTKFHSLIKAIRDSNSKCKIIVSSILPRPLDDDSSNIIVKDVNNQLKAECTKQNMFYIATNKLFLKSGKPVSEYYYDGLHLTSTGVMRLRQMFSQRMAALGNKPTTHTSAAVYFRRHQWSKF